MLGLGALVLVGGSLMLLLQSDDDSVTLSPPVAEKSPTDSLGEAKSDAEGVDHRPAIQREAVDQEIADFYQELLALHRRDRAAFRMQVEELLSSSTDARKRLVALKAWYETQTDPVPALGRALTDPLAGPGERELALEGLQAHCQVDGRARKALIGFLAQQPGDIGQRTSAFTQVLRWADAGEIQECMPLLHNETDANVVVAAARALKSSQTPEARGMLEALHWQHPDAEVRKKLRALGIGR